LQNGHSDNKKRNTDGPGSKNIILGKLLNARTGLNEPKIYGGEETLGKQRKLSL
jgi:hypothetical protein